MGASSQLRPPEGTRSVVGENSEQIPLHMTKAVEPSLPVQKAVDEILYGIHDGMRESSKIMESEIDRVDSNDECWLMLVMVKFLGIDALFFYRLLIFNFCFMLWNCQGIGHPRFHKSIREYDREFSVDFMVLFET